MSASAPAPAPSNAPVPANANVDELSHDRLESLLLEASFDFDKVRAKKTAKNPRAERRETRRPKEKQCAVKPRAGRASPKKDQPKPKKSMEELREERNRYQRERRARLRQKQKEPEIQSSGEDDSGPSRGDDTYLDTGLPSGQRDAFDKSTDAAQKAHEPASPASESSSSGSESSSSEDYALGLYNEFVPRAQRDRQWTDVLFSGGLSSREVASIKEVGIDSIHALAVLDPEDARILAEKAGLSEAKVRCLVDSGYKRRLSKYYRARFSDDTLDKMDRAVKRARHR